MSINDNDNEFKKKVGKRFRYFREHHLEKTQAHIAYELGVHQSTVTNIELGNSFPKLEYLVHLNRCYKLDINWLLMELGSPVLGAELDTHCGESYKLLRMQFAELADLMKITEFRQVILAKMTELKAILKDEIMQYNARSGRKFR